MRSCSALILAFCSGEEYSSISVLFQEPGRGITIPKAGLEYVLPPGISPFCEGGDRCFAARKQHRSCKETNIARRFAGTFSYVTGAVAGAQEPADLSELTGWTACPYIQRFPCER